MKRKQLLNKAFQRGHLLTLKNKLYKDWITKFIVDEVKGDIGSKGDITTNSVLKKGKKADAIVYVRENGIIAGISEAKFLYNKNDIDVNVVKNDGSKVKKGDAILKLKGKEEDLLRIERSALDLMQRMSGIATLASKLIKLTKNKIGIAPTRKTQWRYLDKKAVYIGGGLTHRLALWESILIKDNHLSAIKADNKDYIETALERAWKNKKKGIFIEIETRTREEAIRAARKFRELNKKMNYPCLIMLDNMKPIKVRQVIKELKRLKLYNYCLFEASGGIKPESIVEYSKTGVDVISMGYLTTASHALDIKQKIV